MRIDVRGSVGGPEGADAAAARAGSAVDGDDGAVVAVLTAAGAGTRLGAGGPKALVEIGGRSLLRRAAQGLADSGVVDHLVVTAPGEHVERFAAELAGLAGAGVGIRVVAGSSASRQASVALGLKAALEACPRAAVVLVHDAARALTPPETVRRVVAAVRAGHDAVVPALAVTDTVKEVAPVGPVGPAPAGLGRRRPGRGGRGPGRRRRGRSARAQGDHAPGPRPRRAPRRRPRPPFTETGGNDARDRRKPRIPWITRRAVRVRARRGRGRARPRDIPARVRTARRASRGGRGGRRLIA